MKKTELENITKETFKGLLSILKSSKNFIVGEAPLVAKEIVLAERVSSIFWVTGSFLLISCGYLILYFTFTSEAKEMGLVVGIAIGIIGPATLIHNLYNLVLTFVAPRIVMNKHGDGL